MTEKVPKGWKRVKLGDVAVINPSEILKKGTLAKKVPMEALHPFTKKISIYEIKPFNGGVKFRNGDTLVARITPSLENGKTAYVDILEENEIGFGSTEFIVLREKKGLSDSHFLYYFAISPEFRDVAIKSMTGSTGRQRVQTDVVFNYKFLFPPLSEQKAIASVLSSLDDKIDLLQRQNQTLEQMAETLFRKWFIEDAKEDWEEKPLDTIANFLNGLACQKYPPKNNFDKLPVLKIKELKNGFSENSDWATSDVPSEYIVVNGDVIFSWSGSLIVKIWDGEKCVLNQHLFKVTSEKYPKWFYYFWIKYYLQQFITIAESKATTMGHIKRDDLSKALVLVPPDEELLKMDKEISPFIEKIIAINNQIRTLAKLRDTLLPKLMSGEVRVKL
ncbi:type I restriction-modification system, S subunit [Deferribacter desulfuricans SSM1]|uniref:Type I restriction-modification system, S subunit n=1 Tax=Deferribacter desulfuricans (strain DSM 14783 / JCM 11476 / NBRC 101012 / SSM1) TaxID=639282 RepID=D3PB23_DEFDS|nr:restriction endonuclease subunit S [Deferribacter desulfuricans]BAI79796.1 type I restriction-modification system, S subunit [Deferribacter desulfuricans SSM1]